MLTDVSAAEKGTQFWNLTSTTIAKLYISAAGANAYGSDQCANDKDGTVDLADAQAAGAKLFITLDPDKDGTLDAKELGARMDAAGLTAADPDKDGTVDAKEYAAAVEAAFKATDPDKDGTIDAKELGSKEGAALLRLLQ